MYVRLFRIFKHKKAMDWHGGGRGRGCMGGATGRREARNRRKRESHISQRMYSECKGEKGNPRTLGSICSDSEDKGDRGLGDLTGHSRGSGPPSAHSIKMPFISPVHGNYT